MLPAASIDQGNQSFGRKIRPWGRAGWELNQVLFSAPMARASSRIPGESMALSMARHSRPTIIITSPIAQKKARYRLLGRRNIVGYLICFRCYSWVFSPSWLCRRHGWQFCRSPTGSRALHLEHSKRVRFGKCRVDGGKKISHGPWFFWENRGKPNVKLQIGINRTIGISYRICIPCTLRVICTVGVAI